MYHVLVFFVVSRDMLVWTLSALMSQHRNGDVSVGTFVNFVWVTIGENFSSDHISAKEENKEL